MDIVTHSGGMPFWFFVPETLLALLNYLIMAVMAVTLSAVVYGVTHSLLSNRSLTDDKGFQRDLITTTGDVSARMRKGISEPAYLKGEVIHET
ncbi:MAG: hypothetical protein KZQ95_03150 [Candidatus Thiodiazotropha sp. (ex Epidulcina cf. delphinae)]|nr:hypothetical protein [Candidatus Thiodiazotropha sp. (ex Epidulcina cf. delphinae)]